MISYNCANLRMYIQLYNYILLHGLVKINPAYLTDNHTNFSLLFIFLMVGYTDFLDIIYPLSDRSWINHQQ